MVKKDLIIEKETDWQDFANEKTGFDLIVDPMVYRSADVYLRGQRGSEGSLSGKSESAAVWQALLANVGSLSAFFDALILSERLPMIDYGMTFDSNVGFKQHNLYQKCNDAAGGTVLTSVHVMGSAYIQAKQAAIENMKQRPEAPANLESSVRDEMSAFDYTWEPDLSGLDELKEDDLPLTRFLYGGLLFSGYAQMAGVGHLIQPKRSRLYLAMSLNANSAAYRHDQELFAELSAITREAKGAQSVSVQVDGLPSFLPYLLKQDPNTPEELLSEALKLRKSGMVKDYRQWRTQLIREWREKGRIDSINERTVRENARALVKHLDASENGIKTEVKASMVIVPIPMPNVSVDIAIPIQRLWGWIQGQLPGRRYTKLLMRLTLADHEYRDVTRQLHTIWRQA
jgi:hypothetical protein